MAYSPGDDAVDPPLSELAPGLGLYQIGTAAAASPGGAVYSYLLTAVESSATVSSPLTLGETWPSTGLGQWNGWYLFLTAPIEDPVRFAHDGRKKFPAAPTQGPDWRGLLWLRGADSASITYQLVLVSGFDPGTRTFLGDTSVLFAWGPFGLCMADTPNVTYADGVFQLSGPSVTFLQLYYAGQAQPSTAFHPYPGLQGFEVSVNACGEAAGAFQLDFAIDPGVLAQQLGCQVRYFYPGATGVESLQYPFWGAPFYPPSPPAQDGYFLGFRGLLHPVLTTDPRWSALVYDAVLDGNLYQTNSASLTSGMFRTTGGQVITLDLHAAPAPLPAALAFCTCPAPGGGETLYLAPSGTYRVVSVGGDTANNGSPAQWMCGLSAQESIELQVGDAIAMEPAMPAFAPQFAATGSPAPGSPVASPAAPATALDATYTTSWVRYPVQAAVTRRYFGQPSRSVYYAVTAPSYSTPVTSLLAELPPEAAFPLVPYGGAYATPAVNPGVPPSLLAAFEGAVLSTDRHAFATAGSSGPQFLTGAQGPLVLAATVGGPGSPTAPGTALTPQGFVVELDEEGRWQRLLVARDPSSSASPPRYLSFDAPQGGTVSRDVATAVLQDDLFLVVSDNARLGPFSNLLTVEGFEFLLDIAEGAAVDTVLIFKFNSTTSLNDLARAPALWTARDTFVADLALTQQRILEALAVADVGSPVGPAKGNTVDPFAYFRTIAEDPSWTGILALNCAIDGNGMPADLQMVLGGIPGQLRAHHLGIERNRLSSSGGGQQIEESSLFGLILYPPPGSPSPAPASPATPLDYQVEWLRVLFANSAITQFAVEVALTIGSLFGREVEVGGVSPPDHLLRMPGQYQHQGTGGAGVVLFHIEPTSFVFPRKAGSARVLSGVRFENGSLTPVSSAPLSPGTRVSARFSLAGSLAFSASPFAAAAAEVDLFSYDALPFSGMRVEMEFDLDAAGAFVPSSRVMTMDLSQFAVTSDNAKARPDSLVGCLPLKVSGFLQATPAQPLSPAKLGAQVVHSLQLEGTASATGSPAVASPAGAVVPGGPPTDYPNVTSTPQFILQYELPLGNLGALSDVASITATLNLGWGPSPLIPDADAAAVFVQLPSLSAGYGSFELQGIVTTQFGDANLLKVELPEGPVYAMLFNNIQLKVLGFAFPPGVVVDFLLFAGENGRGGQAGSGSPGSAGASSNIAWYLSAQQAGKSP